jgi:hypothetical protein
MSQVIAGIVGLGLVAFMIDSVVHGTWYGTWCASGKPTRGPQFHGRPHSDR